MNHTKQTALFKPTKKTRWKNKSQAVRRKQKILRSELTGTNAKTPAL